MWKCACTHTRCCERGHVDATEFWQTVCLWLTLKGHPDAVTHLSLVPPLTSPLSLSVSQTPNSSPYDAVITFHEANRFFPLSKPFVSVCSSHQKQRKCWPLQSSVTMVSVLISSICACVSTREQGRASLWVGVSRPHVSCSHLSTLPVSCRPPVPIAGSNGLR